MEDNKSYSEFKISEKSINPSDVPQVKLSTGSSIPMIGMGTFGSDHVTPEQVSQSVMNALSLGYRHLDCASIYGNEKEIGSILKHVLDSNKIKREELWITSKVCNNMHADGDVIKSCKQFLKALGLDYLDLFLIHWPFPNHHSSGCTIESRMSNAKPYIHENYMIAWRQMEQLYNEGLVKHIGTSNMTIPKMQLLLKDAKIKPHCNELELHPNFQQPEFFDYIVENGIVPIGYSPIGSPDRPERDKTPEDTIDIQDPVIVEIGQNHKIHPAVVCLKWAVQRGQIPIPFSTKERNLLSNIKSTVEDPLTDAEMKQIAQIDKNCRLIKGDVFLWKENQTWEALWDLDGVVTPR